MKRKILMLFVAITLIMASCGDKSVKPNADKEQQQKTEIAMQEANRQVGMPAIVNFQEKKLMKLIYELRDQENLICYAYLYNRNNGSIGQFLGKCIGFGLPYSTQFSNPEKIVVNHYYSGGGLFGKLPQPEPNGLFMPEGLSATWLLLLDEKGVPHPVYIEPEIIVSPFKLDK